MYINLKQLSKFHTIWSEINGHIYGPRTDSKWIDLYGFYINI